MQKCRMTLEEVVYPIRRDPDVKTEVEGHHLDVYEISGHFIGYELNDVDFRKKWEKAAAEARKGRKKKS